MQTVDVNVPRFNQAIIALLTGVAFLVDQPWMVVLSFAILLASWMGGPRLAPLTRLYVAVIRPRLKGAIVTEPAAPPRFAQLLGSVFLGAASLGFLAGFPALGWALALTVTALAALAAVSRICVGCIFYERVVAR